MTEVLEKTFNKYPSIENAYRSEFIEKIKLHGWGNKPWYLSEKVHGSNTQVSYDGTNISLGTRNHELEQGEGCYNFQREVEKDGITDKIKEIYNELKLAHPNISSVIIFGEICGGFYPHEQVAKVNNASKVQKGVYYNPDNKWLIFDICYVIGEGKHFLGGKDFLEMAKKYSLQTVPLLAIAENLDDALAYANDKPSIVGTKLFGYPELNENIMEGVVIRGYEEDYFMGQTRAIIKNKNEKFAEKAHEKTKNVQQEPLSEESQKALDTLMTYVTENRVNNVISHLGEVRLEDIGKIIGLTNKDILDEAMKDGNVFNTLEKAEEKRVTRMLNTAVSKVVRDIMLKR